MGEFTLRKKSVLVRHLLATAAVVALVYACEPASAQTFNWTGPYVGVNLGYIGAMTDTTWPQSVSIPQSSISRQSQTTQGILAGLTGGYSYQFPGSHFVIGGEADIDVASGSKQSAGGGFDGEGFSKTKIASMGTFRGRFGYAADRALFFGTAGLALSKITNTANIFGDFAGDTAHKSGWRAGWVAGGGMEYAVTNNCILKIEALYADFGKTKAANSSGCVASFKNTAFVTRVGAAWKF